MSNVNGVKTTGLENPPQDHYPELKTILTHEQSGQIISCSFLFLMHSCFFCSDRKRVTNRDHWPRYKSLEKSRKLRRPGPACYTGQMPWISNSVSKIHASLCSGGENDSSYWKIEQDFLPLPIFQSADKKTKMCASNMECPDTRGRPDSSWWFFPPWSSIICKNQIGETAPGCQNYPRTFVLFISGQESAWDQESCNRNGCRIKGLWWCYTRRFPRQEVKSTPCLHLLGCCQCLNHFVMIDH